MTRSMPAAGTDPDAAAARNLWGAVLLEAVSDCLRPRASAGEIAWLGGANFRMVCALAGFDPDFIHDRVRQAIDSGPGARRAFVSGLGKNHAPRRIRSRLARSAEVGGVAQ